MEWLITTKINIELDKLDAKLSAWGCERVSPLAPIPLGDDEQVIEVTGPKDLPQKAAGDDIILKVSSNPEFELF